MLSDVLACTRYASSMRGAKCVVHGRSSLDNAWHVDGQWTRVSAPPGADAQSRRINSLECEVAKLRREVAQAQRTSADTHTEVERCIAEVAHMQQQLQTALARAEAGDGSHAACNPCNVEWHMV